MSDSPAYPSSNGDTGVGTDGGSTPSTPRWVKASGIIALVLVLLLGILFLYLTGFSLDGLSGLHTSPIQHGG